MGVENTGSAKRENSGLKIYYPTKIIGLTSSIFFCLIKGAPYSHFVCIMC